MANGTLKVSNIETSSGSGTITLGQSGETVTVTNGIMSGHMYPAFEAYLSANQSINDITDTKVQFNTEVLDTDSCYDNSTNYRFTPNKAGKYFVYITCNIDASSGFYYASSEVKKNGSNISGARIVNIWENKSSSSYDIEGIHLSYHGIVEMNGSSDYLSATAYMAGGGSAGNVKGNRTIWGAYRIVS